MKKVLLIVLFLLLIFFLIYPSWSLDIEEKEDIQKKLTFSGTNRPRTLFIDNVFGSIEIIGHNDNEVNLSAEKIIKGRTKEKIERAKKEVKLEISEKDNSMEIFVNGPFRHRNRSTNWHCERTGYIVQYNLKLKVPRKMDIFIKTVNNGDINVTNIEGDFTVKNVNGRIQMKKITGSGKAHTVNGRVKVTFNRNPETNCSFRTINGDIELTFPKKPSADFFVKTFNGGIYSAYNVRYLPAVPSRGKRINGKFVYKCNRFQGIRIGNGGPKIKMDTLNGDILIALKKN